MLFFPANGDIFPFALPEDLTSVLLTERRPHLRAVPGPGLGARGPGRPGNPKTEIRDFANKHPVGVKVESYLNNSVDTRHFILKTNRAADTGGLN